VSDEIEPTTEYPPTSWEHDTEFVAPGPMSHPLANYLAMCAPPVAARVEGEPLPGPRRSGARRHRVGQLTPRSSRARLSELHRRTTALVPTGAVVASFPRRSRPLAPSQRYGAVVVVVPVVAGFARSAFHVAASTIPVAGSLLSVWNCLTAVVVVGPNTPSGVPTL
jgi:hypothetical protein